MEDDKNEEGLLKSKYYFDLKGAVDDVSMAYGAPETLGAGAKLVGKSLFNAGLFAGKLGLEIVKEIPGALANQAQKTLNEKGDDLSSEQKSKLEKIVSDGNSLKEKMGK